MKIPNPFMLIVRAVWWPFSAVLRFAVVRFVRSERAWTWWMATIEGARPELVAKLTTIRLRILNGDSAGASIAVVAVEKSQAEQAEKQSEANPS